MRNTSGPKFSTGILFVFLLGMPAARAADSWENLGKAVIEKYEETSAPLFQSDEPEIKDKLKDDPFFEKVRKKNLKFTKEEQERRRAFIEKVRGKNWENDRMQEELAAFQKKELARRKKFIEKQQKKILKHQEEES